jgi:hypothetical protein
MRPWSWRHKLAVIGVVTLLTGCAQTVEIPAGEPPLFDRIDAKVGVVYGGGARSPVVSDAFARVEIGRASVAQFRNVFASMFTKTVDLADLPPWREQDLTDLDGVIELQQTQASLRDMVLIGTPPNANFFHVAKIAYRICLYGLDGGQIKCWEPSAQQQAFPLADYGSSFRRSGCKEGASECVAELVYATMREAIARFMTEADVDPVLRALGARAKHGARP